MEEKSLLSLSDPMPSAGVWQDIEIVNTSTESCPLAWSPCPSLRSWEGRPAVLMPRWLGWAPLIGTHGLPRAWLMSAPPATKASAADAVRDAAEAFVGCRLRRRLGGRCWRRGVARPATSPGARFTSIET